MPKQRFIIRIDVDADLDYLDWLHKNLYQISENQLTDTEASPFMPPDPESRAYDSWEQTEPGIEVAGIWRMGIEWGEK